jgi:hypothetical protein
MWSAEAVLVCALALLNRSGDTFPPIVFVHTPPVDASRDAEAYVRSGVRRIIVVTSSRLFVRARQARYRCGDRDAIRKLASVLVHEEWHVVHGDDEAGAYQAQLMTLRSLNAGPGTPVFGEVARSMRLVLRNRGAGPP